MFKLIETVGQETENKLIVGDNLAVLKELNKTEYGQVKCIYIDPPYNFGAKFVYFDEWSHEDWILMMVERLTVAKSLMREDGTIAISIDDHEQPRLRLLMDELFGEENFIANIIWKRKGGGGYSNHKLYKNHEYILLYAKDKSKVNLNGKERTDENVKENYPYMDMAGRFRRRGILNTRKIGKSFVYDIVLPDGSVVKPVNPKNNETCGWIIDEKEYLSTFKSGEIDVGNRSGLWTVYIKERPQTEEDGSLKSIKHNTLWDDVATNLKGKAELDKMTGNTPIEFNFPKPVDLIKRVVSMCSNPGDLILDFFGGSGTTGHAVLALNEEAENEAPRNFIIVELETDIAMEVTKARISGFIKAKKGRKEITGYSIYESI